MSDNSVNYFISFKYNPSGTNSAIRDLGRLNGKFSESGRSMAQLSALLNRTQRMYASSTDINRAKAYAGMIDQIKLRIKELEVATASCTTKTRGFFSKLKETTGVGAVGVVGMGAAILGRQVFDELNTIVKAAAQVERYGVTLKTLLQSSSGASERMDEYFDIAKKTPFSLESVVEGGNKLQSLGRYSRENLIMLGDLAAAAGKPLEQVMTAYSQLATGQKGDASRMFRDLLISQKDWIEATGKGVSKNGELLASTEEMITALPKILKSKNFMGMMAEQAKTTEGQISNLRDGISQLKVAVGERMLPLTKRLVSSLSNVVDITKRWVAIPTIQKIAAEKVEVNHLMNELIRHNGEQDTRLKLIDEIQRRYPELLKNLDTEKMTVADLRDRLKEVNSEYDDRMKKAILSGMVERIQKRYADKMEYVVAYETQQYVNRENRRIGQEKLAMLKQYGLENANIRDDGSVFYYKNGVPTDYSPNGWSPELQRQWAAKTAEQKALLDMTKYNTPFMTGEKAAEAKRAAEAYQKSIISLESQMKALMPKGTTTDGKDTNSKIIENQLQGTSGSTEIAGSITSGGPKVVNITLGKFLDNINIYPQTLQDGTSDIESRILEMFGRVVVQGGYAQ